MNLGKRGKTMARRNLLHISKLEDLKKWLVKDGWELLPLSNNPYEVLRASKAGKQNPLIIYSGKSSEHLSFADRDMPVIGAFIRDQKKLQTNADRIRSMTDEELAEWITNMCEFERHGESYKSIYNLDTDNEEEIHDSYGDLLRWLKAESGGIAWRD